jgi:fatty acid synthase
MEIFLKETSFHGIMLDHLFAGTSERKKILNGLLNEGIKSGAVQPLTRTVFAEDEVEQAFRYSCLYVSEVQGCNTSVSLS